MAVVPAVSNYFDRLTPENQQDTTDSLFRRRKCLCGFCDVQVGVIGICIIEVVLLAHSLIFAFITVGQGKTRYIVMNPEFSNVVQYECLVFILVVQSLWVITNFTTIYGIKSVRPILILLNFCIRILAIVNGLSLSTLFLVNILHTENYNWVLLLSLSIFSFITIFTVYTCFVLWQCYKYLKELKILTQIKRMWMAKNITLESKERKEESVDFHNLQNDRN